MACASLAKTVLTKPMFIISPPTITEILPEIVTYCNPCGADSRSKKPNLSPQNLPWQQFGSMIDMARLAGLEPAHPAPEAGALSSEL